MPDNVPLPASSGKAATDEVDYSSDTDAQVQLFRPVHVEGAEGAKTVVPITSSLGVKAIATASDGTPIDYQTTAAGNGLLVNPVTGDGNPLKTADEAGDPATATELLGVAPYLDGGSGDFYRLPGSAGDGLLVDLGANNDVGVGPGFDRVESATLAAAQFSTSVVDTDGAATLSISIETTRSGSLYIQKSNDGSTWEIATPVWTGGGLVLGSGAGEIQSIAAGTTYHLNVAGIKQVRLYAVVALGGTVAHTFRLSAAPYSVLVSAGNALATYDRDGEFWDVDQDGQAFSMEAVQTYQVAGHVFNGTTWDRLRGDVANGLDVDVTRLPALAAGTNNIGDVDIASLPNEGQQTMANSISVAVASDQSALPVADSTGNGHLATIAGDTTDIETAVELIDDAIKVDDAGFTVATDKVMMQGALAVAHGSNPDAADANDAVVPLTNRHRVQFVIGGHPNTVTLKHGNITTAVTDQAIVSVSAGTKIVVTRLTVTLDNASTVFPTCVIGFGATNTPTTTGVLFAHGGVPAGGGATIGDGSGVLGAGADGEDLRVTTTGNATGNGLQITVSYYTIES